MLVGAKVCDLTEDLLWFVCGLYVGILMSPLILTIYCATSRYSSPDNTGNTKSPLTKGVLGEHGFLYLSGLADAILVLGRYPHQVLVTLHQFGDGLGQVSRTTRFYPRPPLNVLKHTIGYSYSRGRSTSLC